MCTQTVKILDNTWYLAKTRDPVPFMRWDDELARFHTGDDKLAKIIIQNPDPNEDGIYGGINEAGVAYISTYIHVSELGISYIRRPYVRLILDARSAKEAVDVIKSFNPRIGGNMFVADAVDCFGIEAAPQEYFVEKIEREAVKTNHFHHLPYQNLSFKKPGHAKWTKTRYQRASELIATAQNLDDIKALLTDTKNNENNVPICATEKERPCFTHSAFVFDTQKREIHYAQGNPLQVPFERFGF
jgi:predicted choloylglycine hydrolase